LGLCLYPVGVVQGVNVDFLFQFFHVFLAVDFPTVSYKGEDVERGHEQLVIAHCFFRELAVGPGKFHERLVRQEASVLF